MANIPSSSSGSWFVNKLLFVRLLSHGGQSSSNVPLSVVELSSHLTPTPISSSPEGDSWFVDEIKEFKKSVSGNVTLQRKILMCIFIIYVYIIVYYYICV